MSKKIMMGPKIYFGRGDFDEGEGSDTGDGSAQTGYNWPYSVWIGSREAQEWDAGENGNKDNIFSYAEYEAWWEYMRFTGTPNKDIDEMVAPEQP